jgi:hypothetical protein
MRIETGFKELIEEIEKITKNDYEITKSNFDGGYLIPAENIHAALEDLVKEYAALKETKEAGNPYEEYDTFREMEFSQVEE